MKSILEKNPLNGNYMLYTSLDNGFAWFFEDLRTANKAKEKLDVLISKKLNLSYKAATKERKFIQIVCPRCKKQNEY